MSIMITSGVKLENIQNGVVLGRKLEAGNFAQAEKFALHEFLRSVRIFALREFPSMREIRTVHKIALNTAFLHFWLSALLSSQF